MILTKLYPSDKIKKELDGRAFRTHGEEERAYRVWVG